MIDKMLIKDSSGKRSVTMTAFVVGVLVVNAKLALSEISIKGFSFPEFSGVDYAAALTALGGVYILRRSVTSKDSTEEQ